jgi:integrase
MPRRATGQIRVKKLSGGGRSFALRFPAYGKREYVYLGTSEDGWDREGAQDELDDILADVRRGKWQPNRATPAEAPPDEPTFHQFASDWYHAQEPSLRERTRVDYRWRLSHLLPFFKDHRLSEITVEEVDRFRVAKQRESEDLRQAKERQLALPEAERERLPRPLSNNSINKLIRLLAAILEQAVEYGYLSRNPAQGRKRLFKESKPLRSYLQPEQVAALLAAAGELDAEAREADTGRRRPLLATLTLAGLRISEGLDLRWRDVNLADRKLRVGVDKAKTDAGRRVVGLTPTLQEVLSEYRTRTGFASPDDFVFPTAHGRKDNPSNVRNRFLAKAVERANGSLAEPMGHVTPHSLRRTFISLLLATGADVPYVMAQAGHNDPKTTLGIYAQVIASGTDHGAALDGLVGAADWAPMGTGHSESLSEAPVPPSH